MVPDVKSPLLGISILFLRIAAFSCAILVSGIFKTTSAFNVDLNENQIQEAVAYGQDPANNLALNSEWAVSAQGLKGWVEIRTPFKAVADYVRKHPARKRFATVELQEVADAAKDRMVFTYFHYKLDDSFTQSPSPNNEYYAFLRQGANYIYPLRYNSGTEFADISMDFTFRVTDLDPSSEVNFIFREPSGYERGFAFDLSRIR